jgi:hypothetical protein
MLIGIVGTNAIVQLDLTQHKIGPAPTCARC